MEFGGLIDGKFKGLIQEKTDEFVASAAPICIHYWPLEEVKRRATGAEDFALPEGEEMGRVVEMVGSECCPFLFFSFLFLDEDSNWRRRLQGRKLLGWIDTTRVLLTIFISQWEVTLVVEHMLLIAVWSARSK